MDFKDTIIQLADRIEKQKDAITTEEGTKNAFIMPMIAALGYDIFNPFEVVPEMDCDLTKKGDKLDYAIMKDKQVILLIECKHCKQNLNLHSTQLSKYYAASNARFGVLTNGIEYRFYTDLDKANIMDQKPFLVVDMLNLADADIEQLKKFHKSYYNESEILSTAQELQIMIQVKDILNKNLQSPGDEFTRYFVKCMNDGKSSAKLIEQYKPIIKKSISSVINDIIQDRLNLASKNVEQQAADIPNQLATNAEQDGNIPQDSVAAKENGIVTTQEEIDAYNIIRSILRKLTDAKRIIYNDTKSYFVIAFDSKWYWICRLSLKPYSKRIGFPTKDRKSCEWVQIKSLDDIFDHAEKLEQSLKTAMKG